MRISTLTIHNNLFFLPFRFELDHKFTKEPYIHNKTKNVLPLPAATPSFSQFGDIFGSFTGFGGFGGGRHARHVNRGTNLRVKVKLTLEEIATGVEKKIKVSMSELIVSSPLLFVTQDIISFCRFFKFLLRLFVARIFIGMIL